MAIKLDIGQAYNHMCLENFGFHNRWIRWILGCVQAPSFAILIKGSLSIFLCSIVKLWQGCPLSSYFLIICTDTPFLAFHMATASQALNTYMPALEAQPILHLFFTYNSILLCLAFIRNAMILTRILKEFCTTSI